MSSKGIVGLNLKGKAIKILLGNTGEYLNLLGWKRLLKHVNMFNIIIVETL